MTTQADSVAEKLGEIRGQLREMIHNQNNHAMKQDGMSDRLARLDSVPEQLTKIEDRLTSLETDRHRRDGAMGFGGWLVKSPLVAWVAALFVIAWTYLRDRGL